MAEPAATGRCTLCGAGYTRLHERRRCVCRAVPASCYKNGMRIEVHAPVAILSYHQTDLPPPRGTPGRCLVVPPLRFERQMRALHALGWRGLSLRDLAPYLRGERAGKVVGLTLDDGFLSNFLHALPVLQRLGFTATAFVVSAHVGGTNCWDAPLGAALRPLMDLPHLRAWARAGMEVGAHTCHHGDLTAIAPSRARAEIVQCRRDLELALDQEVRSFSYPYGRHRAEHVAWTRTAGYEWAVTTFSQRACAGADPLRLPRITVWSSTPLPLLLGQVATGLEDRQRAIARAVRCALMPQWHVPAG